MWRSLSTFDDFHIIAIDSRSVDIAYRSRKLTLPYLEGLVIFQRLHNRQPLKAICKQVQMISRTF